jgi:hypothetical protein
MPTVAGGSPCDERPPPLTIVAPTDFTIGGVMSTRRFALAGGMLPEMVRLGFFMDGLPVFLLSWSFSPS